MNGMRWGQGDYRLGEDPARAMFRGRAGVVVEVAPNQYVSWRMQATFGEVEMETEVDEIHSLRYSEPLAYVSRLTVVTFNLTGHLDSSDDRAEPPAWATETHEIEARRSIGGRS